MGVSHLGNGYLELLPITDRGCHGLLLLALQLLCAHPMD